MKKLVTTILACALCAAMAPMIVSADAVMGSGWKKESDTKYSVSGHVDGDAYFDYYELGSADTVTLSAKITVGGQKGFLFGVKDVNNDGQIREGGDQYYLIDVTGTDVKIERNDKTWGDWSVEGSTGKKEGDTCVLKVTYKKGTINVYIDDTLVLEYGDPNPDSMGGTGFGLCAKSNSTFEDVAIDTASAVNNTLPTGGIDVSKATDNANWTVEEDTYTLKITNDSEKGSNRGNNFATYTLGNTDKKVTLTADITVSEKAGWGGDTGFLFAVTDRDNDGVIEEVGDYYYLVEISCVGDHIIAIEKNQGRWGQFTSKVDYNTNDLKMEKDQTYTFSATYDPEAGTITVSVDGKEVLKYNDANPLQGTGYALASKTFSTSIKNVAVDVANGASDDDNTTTTEAPATTTQTPATTTAAPAATTAAPAATTAAPAATTAAPAATTTVAGKGETTAPTTTQAPDPSNPGGSPATGTAAVVIAAVAAISLVGVVVAVKKREQD